MNRDDRLALVRPALDAHNLGITTVAQLLEDCGCLALTADAAVCRGFEQPEAAEAWIVAEQWLKEVYRAPDTDAAATALLSGIRTLTMPIPR